MAFYYHDPKETLEFMLNGTTLTTGNLSATTTEGQTIEVASIIDKTEVEETTSWGYRMTDTDNPKISVVDVNGNEHDFDELCYVSQCAITDYACDNLF